MKKIVTLFLILIFGCATQPNIEYKEYKDKLIETARRCYDRQLFWGSGGDISVKIPGTNKFIVKSTGYSLGYLDYDKITTMTFDNDVIEGRTPSHEAPIHGNIYKIRKDVGAILHMHAPYSTAWATAGMKVPPVTQQSVKLLAKSGIVKYYPVGSNELIDEITNLYKDEVIKVVFMENHGVFVVGKDLDELLNNAELVENTARIAYLLKSIGTPKEFKFE
ncbi:class II aldolase/adducin family protein [Melioribacter sp. OK-6-Me]|uniref:class II aldolase/adducin family protein n=1 Tax=unclassified Melioribacter TaxID=2627329 RepID=UPI003EDB24BC